MHRLAWIVLCTSAVALAERVAASAQEAPVAVAARDEAVGREASAARKAPRARPATAEGEAKPGGTADTKSEGAGEALKGVIREAAGAASPSADGGVAEGPRLDVEKLPFTPDSIRQVVAFHMPKVQACYEEMLAGKTKALEGKLNTRWTITADGLVKGAAIRKKGTTIKDGKLHDCVLAVVSSMEFPKPADGKSHPIDFPFNLKAEK